MTDLHDALETAYVAMKLASALPCVAQEYDFQPAIDKAAKALGYTGPDAWKTILETLESIAKSTCCEGCQEAALVAQSCLDNFRASEIRESCEPDTLEN